MATPVEQVGETVARAAAAQAAAVKAAVRAIIRALKTGDRDKAKATANRQRKAVLAASHDRGAAVARKVATAYGLPMSKPAERGRSVVRQRDSMELNDAIDKIIDQAEEHDDTGLDDFELDDPEIRPIEDLLESEAQSVYEKSIITTTKRELARGGVVGARRVIHPEASAGGTCGLCVAAATRKYNTSQLQPIHDRCKCTVLPIIKVGRHEIDPGNDVNYSDIDLDKAYKQLEGSTRSKLSNQRFVPGDDGKLRRKAKEPKRIDRAESLPRDHGQHIPQSEAAVIEGSNAWWQQRTKKPWTGSPGRIAYQDGAEPKPEEMPAAHTLAEYGINVEFRKVLREKNVKNPDVVVMGEIWDIKAPKGSGNDTISKQFRRAKKQCESMILDLYRCGLPDKRAIAESRRRFYGQTAIKRLILIDKQRRLIYLPEVDKI